MKIAVISFTRKGAEKAADLVELFLEKDCNVAGYTMPSFCNSRLNPIDQKLDQWMKNTFLKDIPDLFVFVSAVGIAVRSVIPFVKDKMTDPAVVVMDEKAEFVIPVLSGHMGGANFWSKVIAEAFFAIPVITTATDVNNVFAVDLFARKNKLLLEDRTIAKKVSADLLDEKTVAIKSIFEIEGKLPRGLITEENTATKIEITYRKKVETEKRTLFLIPKCICIGVGCKRGTSAERIKRVVKEMLDANNIDSRAVEKIATIDIKKDEKGIVEFAKSQDFALEFYSAKELRDLNGAFAHSEFVESITGVGNVCERAAVLAASGMDRQGKLIVHKMSSDGITAAAACSLRKISFEV